MTNLPRPVKVDVADWQALQDAGAKMAAAQQALDSFSDRITAQIAAAQGEARAIWAKLNQKHGDLNLNNIAWEPGDEPGLLVPVSMRLRK